MSPRPTKGPLLGPNNRRKRPDLDWSVPTKDERKVQREARRYLRGERKRRSR